MYYLVFSASFACSQLVAYNHKISTRYNAALVTFASILPQGLLPSPTCGFSLDPRVQDWKPDVARSLHTLLSYEGEVDFEDVFPGLTFSGE